MGRTTDILCAGELLVDFITAEFVRTLDEATLFRRIPGGSPANLWMIMARLGYYSMLAASVGNDDMGTVLKNYVSRLGVDVSCVTQVDDPTTLILVTRSAAVSNFQPYRGADNMHSIRQIPYGRFEDLSLFHTTCFALSKNPARDVILQAAQKAQRVNVQLSIDANYAEKIWPDRREAQRIVSEYCRMRTLVKVSDVDFIRLYGDENPSPQYVLDHFLKMGASEVCFTLGDKGCWVSDENERHFLPAREVDVVDTTGAGDAFTCALGVALAEGRALPDAVRFAVCAGALACTRLGVIPALPYRADVETLLASAP